MSLLRSASVASLVASLLLATLMPTALGREPGTVPFNFPVLETTTAAPGEYVLAPNLRMFEGVVEDDGDGVLIWYTQTYVGPNETAPGESIIENVFDTFSMPNSLIIPLGPATEPAAEGDILLSWWQTGSGMQRCYVVDASDPTQPLVKYLDLDLDNPATTSDGIGIGRATYQLEPGTFQVLSKATGDFPPGSGAACRERGSWASVTYTQVISTSTDKLLGLGFAGRVTSYPIEGCVSVPVSASFSPGDVVFASDTFLNMREATIASFDSEFGRYNVVFSSDEEPTPIGNLIANLDALPSTLSPTATPTVAPIASTSAPTQGFPPECLPDLGATQTCTTTLGTDGQQACLGCWEASLPDSPDGCDEGKSLFCSAFATCDPVCGTCRETMLSLTNCLVESAQSCGFPDPLCDDDTSDEPSSVPTVAATESPSAGPTLFIAEDDDDDLPLECLAGFQTILTCTEDLGTDGEACVNCWSEALPQDDPDSCEDGRSQFCTNFGATCEAQCGKCKDPLLELTNCLVEVAQNCGFSNPLCAPPSGSSSTTIGRFTVFAMLAIQAAVAVFLQG